MNVGDALTFKILTDDHETTIFRSVVRSASPRAPVNQRILFDPNLDPSVQQNRDNQNLELPKDFLLADVPLPAARKKKRFKTTRQALGRPPNFLDQLWQIGADT
jgi:hypothetical protein